MNVSFCGETAFPILSYPPHQHKEWEIIINTSGKNKTLIGEHSFNIYPGSVMVIPPNTPHSAISQKGYTDMYVQAQDLDFNEIFVISDCDGNIETLARMLHKIISEKEENYRVIADSMAETIFQIIKKYRKERVLHPAVLALKNTIYQNISNPDFSIRTESAKFGYNTDYVRRRFFKELHKTPKEYLISLRLELAKKLLLQENFISIEDVAMKCGFSDPFYFSTSFKNAFKLSPTKYRKK